MVMEERTFPDPVSSSRPDIPLIPKTTWSLQPIEGKRHTVHSMTKENKKEQKAQYIRQISALAQLSDLTRIPMSV